MKDIDKQDQQDVSGGYRPGDGGCFPPSPIDYPQYPLVPQPDFPSDPLPETNQLA